MKVRYYTDESGCFGAVNEVVLFEEKFVKEKTKEELNEFLRRFISYFGCSGCVSFEIVDENVPHDKYCIYDKKWQQHLLEDVKPL